MWCLSLVDGDSMVVAVDIVEGGCCGGRCDVRTFETHNISGFSVSYLARIKQPPIKHIIRFLRMHRLRMMKLRVDDASDDVVGGVVDVADRLVAAVGDRLLVVDDEIPHLLRRIL